MDEIDASGAFRRKIPQTEDPTIVQYSSTLIAMAIRCMMQLIPDIMLGELIAHLATDPMIVSINGHYQLMNGQEPEEVDSDGDKQ